MNVQAEVVTPVAPRVRIDLAARITGLTKKAIQGKIYEGKWLEKREYYRDPDGHIWIDVQGVMAWIG